jgi:hypothetical protein
VPTNRPSFITTLLFVGVPLLFITKGRMAFVAAAMASACLMLYGQLSLTGDNMTVLLSPVVVWMGVLGTCGMVGARKRNRSDIGKRKAGQVRYCRGTDCPDHLSRFHHQYRTCPAFCPISDLSRFLLRTCPAFCSFEEPDSLLDWIRAR